MASSKGISLLKRGAVMLLYTIGAFLAALSLQYLFSYVELDPRIGFEFWLFVILIYVITVGIGVWAGFVFTVSLNLINVIGPDYIVGLPTFLSYTQVYMLLKTWLVVALKLSREAAHFRSLADVSIHPIILSDGKGKMIYSSKTIENILGHTEYELSMNGIVNYVHPDDKDKFEQFNEQLIKHPGEKMNIEVRIKNKSGEWLWFRNDAVNLLHSRHIRALVSSFQNITRQKLLDEQQRASFEREQKARAEAEHAVATRDKFLSIASHELKTPLTTILLHLRETISRTLTQSLADFSGEKLVGSLKIAEQQSNRLTQMIQDLLNVSLVSTGRIQIQPQPGELGELVKDAVKSFEEFAEKHQIKIKVEVHDNIPGEWDLIRVEQIISNLLTNAFKYGDGKPVRVLVRKAKDQAYVQVIDQGVGISKEEAEKIFVMFHRVQNSSNQKGLGVGLFISRQIALSHGGDLVVESTPGKGSVFTLRLPIHTKVS